MDTPKQNDITFFAETRFRGEHRRFGIRRSDRRRHTYVIGKTGMGKSTMLENMAIQDIVNDQGMCVVDPHGEFADKMLRFVPEHRKKDVIYFNPSDTSFPLGFNPIEHVPAEQRHIVSSGLMGVFKKIWPDVWSARMEYLLMNTILALLEIPDATLLGINRMLGEKEFRKWIVSQLTDQTVRAFWENEFAKYTDKFMTEAIAPIQNKVGQFVSNPLIRNIVGQKVSTFSIREAMDEGKIIIMNLSKGRIGEENSRLLGAMLITKIYLTAMSRVDIVDETKRRDFYLYVDEFQNFATESFASILSEARKYRLNLILAHQYIAQMDEKVQDAVFGNVGTMVAFRVGPQDAEILEKEFAPEFELADIISLGFAQVYLKLMIDGVASRPFMATTLPPTPLPDISFEDAIIAYSQEHYARPREGIEQYMREWYGQIGGQPVSQFAGNDERPRDRDRRPMQARDPNRKMFEAKCAVDGEIVLVPFEPDDRRPIYCERHLAMLRSWELAPLPPPVHPRTEREPERRPAPSVQPRMERAPEVRRLPEASRSSAHVGSNAHQPRQDASSVREHSSVVPVRPAEPQRLAPPAAPRVQQSPPLARSEPVIRTPDTIKPLSLTALGKEQLRERPRPEERRISAPAVPLRRELNLAALRATIEKNAPQMKNEKLAPTSAREEHREEKRSEAKDIKKEGILEPGDEIRFD